MRNRWLFALLFVPLLAMPTQAGVLFGKKPPRPDPKQRVPELIAILKTDKDADKRSRAAEELRNYDPAVFGDLVPALLDALAGDASSGVRIEAAHSLSKLRPVTTNVGEALEQSVAKDPSMRVRIQARSALLQYHWAGYRGKKTDVPPLNPTREPPLAGGEKAPPAIDTTPPLPPPSPIDQPRIRPVPQPVDPPTPKVTPTTPKVTPRTKEPPLNELPPSPPVKEKKTSTPLPLPPAPNTEERGPDLS